MDEFRLWTALAASISAFALSLRTYVINHRHRSADSYATLVNSFNEIIGKAIADDDVRSVFDELFFGETPAENPVDVSKRRWCYIRVLNIFQRYYLETRVTRSDDEMKFMVLNEMLADLLKNADVVKVLEECRYTPEFRQECVALSSHNRSESPNPHRISTGPLK